MFNIEVEFGYGTPGNIEALTNALIKAIGTRVIVSRKIEDNYQTIMGITLDSFSFGNQDKLHLGSASGTSFSKKYGNAGTYSFEFLDIQVDLYR